MTQWIQELVVLLEAEFHARRVLATLATVDLTGRPRARMVFVRDVNEQDGSLVLTTDSRSEKMHHLSAMPVAELVFWTPHERQQFRLLGGIDVVHDGAERLDMWNGLAEASQALFFWPVPGGRVEGAEAYVKSPPAGAGPPENFVLLVLHPTEVESLELNEHPHRRRRWRKAQGWRCELINP